MNAPTSQQQALDQLVGVLDSTFFKALAEPVRIEIIRRLIAGGASNIGDIAADMPQDRSVISRHLQVLADAGLVSAEKRGRQRFYALAPGAFIRRLESILATTRRCVSVCCPQDLPDSGS